MLSSSVPPASASRTEKQQWARRALRDLSVKLRHRLGDGTQITTQTKATFQTPTVTQRLVNSEDDNKEEDTSLQQGDLCWYGTRKRSVPHNRSRWRRHGNQKQNVVAYSIRAVENSIGFDSNSVSAVFIFTKWLITKFSFSLITMNLEVDFGGNYGYLDFKIQEGLSYFQGDYKISLNIQKQTFKIIIAYIVQHVK